MFRNWWYSKTLRSLVWRITLYIILLIGSFFLLIPLVWTVSTSLKSLPDVFVYPPKWIPNPISWSNYPEALSIIPFHSFIKNSFIISLLCICGYLLSASLCAYGFARLKFPGREVLFLIVLLTMMIPWAVVFVPQYIIFSKLGWVDTFKPLIVPAFLATGGGGAFFIFLLRQFFLSLPVELEDAAKLDGYNNFGIYWWVALPLAKPALGIVAIFSFMWTWNDFQGPLIYLRSLDKFTLALGLTCFLHMYGTWWHYLMVATVVAILPCIILFVAFQKYFIQGIVITGIKG